MALIEMVLAAGPDRPAGDVTDRIALRADLTAFGYLDIASWFARKADWTFTRARPAGKVSGELVREGAGGAGESWAVRGPDGADGPLWPFETRVLRPGEYATLRRPQGGTLVYRVVSVVPEPW
jgi:hypothetical protein